MSVNDEQVQNQLGALRGKLSVSIDNKKSHSAEAWQKAMLHTMPVDLYDAIARILHHHPNVEVQVKYQSTPGKTRIKIIPDSNDKGTIEGYEVPYFLTFDLEHATKTANLVGAFISPSEQATGISTKFLRLAFSLAQDYHCDTITVKAGPTMGAYVWSRMGFKPDLNSWQKTCDSIRQRLSLYKQKSKDMPPQDDKHYGLLQPHEHGPDDVKDYAAYVINKKEYQEITKCLDRADPEDALLFANILTRPFGQNNGKDITLGRVLLCGETCYSALPTNNPQHEQYKQFWHYTDDRLRQLGEQPEQWHANRR